jgi:hypothetical protein
VAGTAQVDGNTTLGDNAAVDLVTFNARVGSDVVPSANNMYDLGDDATPLRWRSGYFGTQVKVGTSVSLVAGMPDRLEYSGDGIVRTSGYLAVETGGAERLRVTAAGDVVVQNQAAGAPTTVLRVLGGNSGAGATQVVLQAGTGQSGVNLLEWRDGTGQLIGVIDDAGFMGIGVNNAGFGGIAAYLHVYSNTAQPAAVFENGIVRIGNIGGSGVSAGPDLQVWDEPGATQVILQLGTAQTGVNLLEWQNAVGTVLGGIDDAGNLFVNTNTTLGDAAGDVVVFNARVGSDVVPSANNMYDLGDDATPLRWRSGYFGTQVKVGASVSLVAATNALEYTGGDGRISVAGASALRVSTNGVERLIVDGSGNVLPGADNAYDLGSATQRWANVYGVNGNFSAVTVSGLTPGSVIFAGAGGALSQDNANFFWDDANNRLGIGTNTPAATLDVVGTAQVSGNTSVGGNLTVDGNTTLGDNAAVDLVTFNARVGSDVVPSANNMYDLGDDATPLRWRSGYFGTQVKVGTSVSLVAGMPDRLEYSGDGIVRTSGYLAVETGGAERLRVTAAGDVVVQNQAAGAPTTVLRVLGGNSGAGATQVVLQAGTGQSGVNLLEWRDGTGQLIGVIDDAGFMGIGVNNAGFGGIAAYLHVYSNTAQPAAVFENGIVRIGNIGGSGVSAGPDLQVWDEPGATQVILQLGTAQTGVNLLEWQNAVGTVLGGIDDAGNLFVNTNTTLGDAAGDVVVFNARVGSDVVPSANNMYDLGDDATPLRWRSGYFGTQVKVGASVSLVAATNALEYTGGDGRISVAGASALRVSTNGVERLIVDGSGNVLPGADNAYDLGSATQRWANVYGVNGNFSAVTVSGLTPGSVIFAGAGGALSQDNANFFWDDANNRLGIGTAAPMATLHVAGTAQVDGNTTLGDNAAVDLVTFNARVGSDVVPSANNMYDLGDDATPLRWRSGYFGTQVKVGTSVSLVAGTPDRLEYSGDGIVRTSGYLAVETGGAERLRVTAAGDVVVQNQAAGAPTTVLRVLGGNGGAGATQVVLQAGTGQSGVNLLEWRDGTGQLIGVIDDAGFMGIGVNNAGFGGIAAYLHVYSNLAQPAAIFENGAVGIGTNAPAFGSTLHIYDARTAPGTGATKVIIQAGANQAGVNLLEWQDNTGLPVGFIDNAGNVAIGDVNNLGFTGPDAYLHVYSNAAQPAAIFENGAVGIGTNAPAFGSTLHIYDARTAPGTGATKVIIQAGVNQALENLLEWQDAVGTVLGGIDAAGNLFVNTNTTLGDAAGDVVTVNAGTVLLPNIPTAAATDEVLRIDPTTGEVKRSAVAAVISAGIIKGSFPIAASGSSFTISVAPADIQPGAIVTVTLVGPSGGTIYPLMVTNVNAVAETITVESSATIPGGMGYAIHYIIINP